MKNFSKVCVAVALLAATSCAMPRPSSGPGWVYTNVKEGVFANSSVEGKKQAELCNLNVLGVVSTGDATVDSVKRQGAIKNVSTIDRTFEGVLGIYAKSCTIVKGN